MAVNLGFAPGVRQVGEGIPTLRGENPVLSTAASRVAQPGPRRRLVLFNEDSANGVRIGGPRTTATSGFLLAPRVGYEFSEGWPGEVFAAAAAGTPTLSVLEF